MAKVRGAIKVDVEKCKGCGLCVVACPTSVIALSRDVNSKGYNYAYMEVPEACTGCANCGLVCPDSVIDVYRVKAGVEA
ncbi:MAG TPA: 4Fe-4S binding protein [Tenuifilaceae bacterium]|jgi:2-oxoglutarate ferredoxin oxidoreductase subunit delta|nr:4Fe-4S binding protein [Bacteroidales bacterium]MDI9515562.1 4Fe-4S binding protein [Bacteroidota bacterium]NLH57377.1 4Fe-4S binding protein [Rikenellaceae bacterium]OQC64581.1 MAG: 2-oxoglutarate-acceptor oxidoreductase subunit OorD [Bacteroidetes bacterium ADurb.Bin008]HNV81368.1 4Fe-4S binding protein [Tenuifilaceae bacterium]